MCIVSPSMDTGGHQPRVYDYFIFCPSPIVIHTPRLQYRYKTLTMLANINTPQQNTHHTHNPHPHPLPPSRTPPTRTPPPVPPPSPHNHHLRHGAHRPNGDMKQLIQIHRRATPTPPTNNRQRARNPPSPNPTSIPANNHHTRRAPRRARRDRRRRRSKEVLLSDVGGAGGVDDKAPRTPRAGTPRRATRPRRRGARGGLVVGENGDARGGGLFAEGEDFGFGEAGEGAGFFFEVEGLGLGCVSFGSREDGGVGVGGKWGEVPGGLTIWRGRWGVLEDLRRRVMCDWREV